MCFYYVKYIVLDDLYLLKIVLLNWLSDLRWHFVLQTLFVQALQLKDGVRQPGVGSVSVDPEVVHAIHRLTHAVDDFDKLAISRRSISR